MTRNSQISARNIIDTKMGDEKAQDRVPPNMAQERSDMLSKAFKATLEDPELLAMAKKLKLSIQYIPGTEIDQSLTEIFSVTPKVKENLRSLVQ